jgi:hypothetical protein
VAQLLGDLPGDGGCLATEFLYLVIGKRTEEQKDPDDLTSRAEHWTGNGIDAFGEFSQVARIAKFSDGGSLLAEAVRKPVHRQCLEFSFRKKGQNGLAMRALF